MKKLSLKFTDLAGMGTWAMVYGLSLYWLVQTAKGYHSDIPLVTLLFVVYLACFYLVTRDKQLLTKKSSISVVLAIQLLSALALSWILPLSFLPILTIIWASILPHVTSISRSVVITLLAIVVWFSLYKFRWQEQVFFSAMLYTSFHLFAILMMHHAKAAEKATEEALQLNAELISTRQLLSEATRQNERTRIARDLHDLLGHHLTALIINLQIASHLTKGEAQEKVSQCHSLAKLLMSDVREAVSSLRENNSIDLESMINQLSSHLPTLTVHHTIKADFELEDIDTAKQLLSCIQEAMTNTLKHSDATALWVEITSNDNAISVRIKDNGRVSESVKFGNGLTGMQERVAGLNGTLQLDTSNHSLEININVPKTHTKLSDSDSDEALVSDPQLTISEGSTTHDN